MSNISGFFPLLEFQIDLALECRAIIKLLLRDSGDPVNRTLQYPELPLARELYFSDRSFDDFFKILLESTLAFDSFPDSNWDKKTANDDLPEPYGPTNDHALGALFTDSDS